MGWMDQLARTAVADWQHRSAEVHELAKASAIFRCVRESTAAREMSNFEIKE